MKGIISLLMAALVAASFTSCKKIVFSCLSTESDVVAVGEPVQFSNCSSNGENYVWHFGDGSTSTEESPTHTYQRPGIYEVTLSASSKKEKEGDKQTITIQVLPNTNTTLSEYGNEYKATIYITQVWKKPLFAGGFADTTHRDTMITNIDLGFTEDGTMLFLPAVYTPGFDPFSPSSCDMISANLSGDAFSKASEINYFCPGTSSTWNGIGFNGLNGSFSDLGRRVEYSYGFTQNIAFEDEGVRSIDVTVSGIRRF